jgi:hypothetical protein
MSAGKAFRWTASLIVTAIALIAVARLSGSPVATRAAGSSAFRLSWSARPERIEKCRQLSKQELAEREEHMRQRIECEGAFATYSLRVLVGGKLVHESIVRGAGLRHDRPIYLLRDLQVSPGTHAVQVSFVRRESAGSDSVATESRTDDDDDSGTFHGRAEREREERARRARAAIPPRLVFDSVLNFAPGKVLVLTLDSERRSLVLLSGE